MRRQGDGEEAKGQRADMQSQRLFALLQTVCCPGGIPLRRRVAEQLCHDQRDNLRAKGTCMPSVRGGGCPEVPVACSATMEV